MIVMDADKNYMVLVGRLGLSPRVARFIYFYYDEEHRLRVVPETPEEAMEYRRRAALKKYGGEKGYRKAVERFVREEVKVRYGGWSDALRRANEVAYQLTGHQIGDPFHLESAFDEVEDDKLVGYSTIKKIEKYAKEEFPRYLDERLRGVLADFLYENGIDPEVLRESLGKEVEINLYLATRNLKKYVLQGLTFADYGEISLNGRGWVFDFLEKALKSGDLAKKAGLTKEEIEGLRKRLTNMRKNNTLYRFEYNRREKTLVHEFSHLLSLGKWVRDRTEKIGESLGINKGRIVKPEAEKAALELEKLFKKAYGARAAKWAYRFEYARTSTEEFYAETRYMVWMLDRAAKAGKLSKSDLKALAKNPVYRWYLEVETYYRPGGGGEK